MAVNQQQAEIMHISHEVVCILRERGQNYLFFNCVLRKQKEFERSEKRANEIRKNKACVFTPYQDVLILSTFENKLKMLCFLTSYEDVLAFFALKEIHIK